MTERGKSYEGNPPPRVGGAGATASDTRRVALVIGNAAYPQAPLKNPRNDAEAFAAKLKAVNPAFDVTLALDVGRDGMEDALERFEAKLGACETALLFFAGHGLQVKGINYLMPVDADIRQETHLKRRAVSLNEVLEIMGRRVRSSSLVFLDACRDNPFARSLLSGLPDDERGRFLTRSGLAEVRAGAGSFVAFATAPDNVALDGSGANSPFTAALVKHMEAPNASINDVMIAVRKDVLKATGGRQEPWDQSSLRERFSFHNVIELAPFISPPPIKAPEPQLSETAIFEKAALEHWDAVKGTGDPERLRAFIADYGTSRMGPLAREAVQKLATAAWRTVQRRNEAELTKFIADFAGTKEVAEARAVLAKLQAEHEAAAVRRERAALRGRPTSGKIFISYRRDDVPGDARGIREALVLEFGKNAVFMDVDDLLAGQRFDEELQKALAECQVLIAVMGPRWMELLTARAQSGERDYVREENRRSTEAKSYSRSRARRARRSDGAAATRRPIARGHPRPAAASKAGCGARALRARYGGTRVRHQARAPG